MLTDLHNKCLFCNKPIEGERAIFIANVAISPVNEYNECDDEKVRVGEIWGASPKSLCHIKCWNQLEFIGGGY
jgi:hypothetical protein